MLDRWVKSEDGGSRFSESVLVARGQLIEI